MPRSTVAAPYDRKSSVTIRSGTTAYFLPKFAHQFQRSMLFAGLDQHIQNLALGVDGAPQVNHHHRFQINLVKMQINAVWDGASAIPLQ